MRWLFLVTALTGCDAVFGLDDTALPVCVRSGFEGAATPLLAVDTFSFTASRDRAVASIDGIAVEAGSDGKNPQPIDIEPMYPMISVALEPNGDYYFFTAAVEPPTILAVTKHADAWMFEPRAPQGYIAGTPTNRMNGEPVRVIVRLFETEPVFLEYQRDAARDRFTVGERFELKAFGGANLTQDGRAIVFDGFHDADRRGVYIAQRATIDDRFAAPQLVLEGAHQQPQLFDDCGTLYAIDDHMLTRFVR